MGYAKTYHLFGGAVAVIFVANHGYKLQDLRNYIPNYIPTVMAIYSLTKWKCTPKGLKGGMDGVSKLEGLL